MPPPLKYRGVYFMSSGGPRPWRAQVVRRRVSLVLGGYSTPDEAARVVDNAAYHLREWAKSPPLYNFPNEVEGVPPSAQALRAEAKLKRLFPNWISEQTADRAKTEVERVLHDGLLAAEDIVRHANTLRQSLTWAMGQLQLQEVQIFQLKEEVAVQKRIAIGLRATGGHNPFRPVPQRPKAKPGEILDPTPSHETNIPTDSTPPPASVAVSDHLA